MTTETEASKSTLRERDRRPSWLSRFFMDEIPTKDNMRPALRPGVYGGEVRSHLDV
jgi:hypothetical protein